MFLILVLAMLCSVSVFALHAETGVHVAGMAQIAISEGKAPYKVYKSTDRQNFEYVKDVQQGEKFVEFGLDVGRTYYYRIVDASGEEFTTSYTTPYVNVQEYPLQVKKLGDTYVHLSWTHFISSPTLYCNGRAMQKSVGVNECTITDLKPDTDYEFYYLARSGEKSNTVKVTTTDDMGKLDKLLRNLFVSDSFRIDTDGDGIKDGFQHAYNRANEIMNHPVVRFPQTFGSSLNTISTNMPAGSIDGMNFWVTFPGIGRFNMLDFSKFANEIKMMRKIMVAVLYSMVLFYFTQLIIPKLGL